MERKQEQNELKYMAVYNQLRHDIVTHKYLPGSRLPSEQGLMNKYSVSRTTIRRVSAMLREEGLVEIRQGRGTVVNPVAVSDSTNQPFRVRTNSFITSRFTCEGPCNTLIQSSIIDRAAADEETAAALGLEPGTEVYRLQRMKLVDGKVYAMVTSYVREDMAPGLDEWSGKMFYLYQFLEEHYGITYETGQERISVTKARFVEARLLDVDIGDPLMISKRTVCCKGMPFEYGVSISRADIIELVLENESCLPTMYY